MSVDRSVIADVCEVPVEYVKCKTCMHHNKTGECTFWKVTIMNLEQFCSFWADEKEVEE